MVTLHIENIPAELLDEHRACGRELADGRLEFDDQSERYRELFLRRAKMATPPPRNTRTSGQKAIPRDRWPQYAATLAALAIPEDRGVGDVIARSLGVAGEIFKTAFIKLTGHECGCSDRQARLNALFPLAAAEAPAGSR